MPPSENPPPLPPGQQLVAAGKWPLVGERESLPPTGAWEVEIAGLVENPRRWTIEQLCQFPQVERTIDIHCVTRWSKLGVRFGGVPLQSLLDEAGVQPAARYVCFVAHSARNHSTSLQLETALSLDALIALTCEGEPLSAEHGGPVRMVVPGRYFYKSLKWLAKIELLPADRLGYWEAEAGYHNRADPWREERYIAPALSKQQATRLIAELDFSCQDLRGLDAQGRELANLNAADALLRDADFRGCVLRDADFRRANLSNAHLQQADLRGANFAEADCEGTNFSGADLRGADFTAASILAATFSPDAQLDEHTRITAAQMETLMPVERQFLQQALS